GDGGLVETSGKHLVFAGTVNTSASKGRTGTLLLDPVDLTIIHDGATASGDLDPTLAANNQILATDTTGADTVTDFQVNASGSANSLLLQASNSIQFSNAVAISMGSTKSIQFDVTGGTGGIFQI